VPPKTAIDTTHLGVIGAGSWGTALALVLASNGHRVQLWGHETSHMAELCRDGENRRHLPGARFPAGMSATSDLGAVVTGALMLVVVVPSKAFAGVVRQLRGAGGDHTPILIATKGLDAGSGGLLHALVEQELPHSDVAVLSGPSFAGEVAAGLPTAVTIAAHNHDRAAAFARPFHNGRFRPYTCADLIGVQLGGAVKNVLAVATGIADGLGLGANTQAGLITRGLAELRRLGVAMGASADTFMGLSGVGDMVLTCTDNQSRNRRFGLGIGCGRTTKAVEQEIGQTVEAITTAQEVCTLAQHHQVDMPICREVNAILSGQRTPAEALSNLMNRPLGEEFPDGG
jgi:glycerol-3-phosphate dehydrogenase (NAD(P)+)